MFGAEPTGRGFGFRVLGYPVTLHPSFLVIALVLGIVPGASVATVAIWVGVVLLSVLVHELGHAVVGRRLGADPVIDIYALGGLTRSTFTEPLTRGQAILLSLAGPFFGFALGAALFVTAAIFGPFEGRLVDFTFDVGVWVNIGWGAINLLPVMPLDGGHVVENLLPGDEEGRARRGAVVSIVTGSLVAVALVTQGLFIGGIVFAMLVATNITALRTESQQRRRHADRTEASELLRQFSTGDAGAADALAELGRTTTDPGLATGITMALIEEWALRGDVARAQAALSSATAPVPPSLHALVTVCASDGVHGLTELVEIAEAGPHPVSAHHLVLGAVRAGRPDVASAAFARTPGLRDPQVLRVARSTAAHTGSPVLVGALAAL